MVLSLLFFVTGCSYQITKKDEADRVSKQKLEIENRLEELEAKILNQNEQLAQKNEELLKSKEELKSQHELYVKTEELEVLVTEESERDFFALKKECASSNDAIIADINAENLIYRKGDPVLEEIFYSPKRESCMYVFRYWPMPEWCEANRDTMSFDEQVKYCFLKNKVLTDFFTKEVVMERDDVGARRCVSDLSAECDIIYEQNEKFDNLLESLK